MAQSPDNKPPHELAERAETAAREDAERKAQAARQISASERSLASAGTSAARHGAEGTRETSQQIGETLRRSGAAQAEAARMGADAGAETIRHGAETLAEGNRRLLEQTAEEFERIGQQVAQTVQETASGFRRFIVLPDAATGSLSDLRESVADLTRGVVQSNLRVTQELFRMVDPAAIFDLQRRFAREYMDTLMQGTSGIIRAVRRATEQTLRPIEEQIEQRRQNHGGEAPDARYGTSGHGQDHGVVADVMSHNVRIATPEDTVQQATRIMRDEDIGVLPVGEGDRLVGVVTDRDVTLRLVAEGKDPARTKVREVMTQDVKYVFEDEDLGHVADNMAEQQVRRLPVVNRNKRLVGVVSLGDLTRASRAGRYAGRAMHGIARETSQPMAGAAE